MGEIADRIAQLRVEVTSPGKNLKAILDGHGTLFIGLRPSSYERLTEMGLATQLADVLDLVSEAYQSAMDRIVDVATGRPSVRGREEWDAKRRRYFIEREEIKAYGRSPSGHIELDLFELRQWNATIAPGTLNELSRHDFEQEAEGAVTAALADFSRQEFQLKLEHGWFRSSTHPGSDFTKVFSRGRG